MSSRTEGSDADFSVWWRECFSTMADVLEECLRRDTTVDDRLIDHICGRLEEALRTISYLSNLLVEEETSSAESGHHELVVPDDVKQHLASLERDVAETLQHWHWKADSCAVTMLEQSYQSDFCRTGRGRGRPAYALAKDDIEGLFELGFSLVETAALLGVSRSTLYRRRKVFGLLGQKFSEIAYEEVVDRVADVIADHNDWGERLIIGALRSQGLRIPRRVVRQVQFFCKPAMIFLWLWSAHLLVVKHFDSQMVFTKNTLEDHLIRSTFFVNVKRHFEWWVGE